MALEGHYSVAGLKERIDAILANLGDGPLSWDQLSEFDQFHVRGLEASRELAEALDLKPADQVLDAGSGMGGPARFLAGTYGCRVVGIELTPLYVEVARALTARVGLDGKVESVQGDALETGFPNDSFDHVWTQHVSMNIEDKGRFFRELARVLKPGGKLALYDVMEGNGEPLDFPVPWASFPSLSFLVRPDDVWPLLKVAGFDGLSIVDVTEQGIEWFGRSRRTPPAPASLPGVLGERMRLAMGNVAKNLLTGRIRLIQIVAQKA